MSPRPRILLLVGYFDWFSGYQETALARWLPQYAETHILASDRVSPIFTDEHLTELGVRRRYETGSSVQNDVFITRLPVREVRSMVWSMQAVKFVKDEKFDLVIQVMPGQGLPVAASLARSNAARAALYGDNAAMWSHLPRRTRALKGAAFAISKGAAYSFVNWRADKIYGYTPDTVRRLRPFNASKPMSLLPLAFDPNQFFVDPSLRRQVRGEYGYSDEDVVLLSAGKFQPKKKLHELVDAFRILAPANPRLRLHLVGADNSQYSREIERRTVGDTRISERVTLSGFVHADRLNGIFNACDVGVWPAMPAITIQQAMGTGLPVVLPRNNWVDHLLRAGAGEFLADGADVSLRDALAEAITLVLDSRLRTPRSVRADGNSWLGADHVSRSILMDAGLVQHDSVVRVHLRTKAARRYLSY